MTLRDELRDLERNATNLLFAGGSVAALDPDVRRAARRLGPLAGTLGALGALAEALRDRPRREAARALLNLASAADRVQRAMAQPLATTGELEPLAPSPALDSPLPTEEVEALHRALTQRSMVGRVARVREAIREGRVRDLRLVRAWLGALEDPTLGAMVTEEVLPLLGPSVAGAVRETLTMTGGDGDARRLRTLVSVEGAGALQDLLPALEAGSPAVRAEALALLARIEPAKAFLRARALCREPGPVELRAAAAMVLGEDPDDEALACLLLALEDPEGKVQEAAAASLGRSPNPSVTPRLQALLEEPHTASDGPASTPDATPAERLAARRQALAVRAEREARLALQARVLRALGARRDGLAEVPPRLLEHPDPNVHRAARRAAVALGHGVALERVASWLDSADPERRGAAVRAVFALEPSEAFERLGPSLTPEAVRRDGGTLLATIYDVLVHERDGEDPRWTERSTGLLKEPLAQSWCVEYLASRGARDSIDALVELLREDSADRTTVLDALMRLGDGRAVEPILDLLERDLGPSNWWALWALESLDDPSAAPRLQVLSERSQEVTTARTLRELAQRLQRDRGSIPPPAAQK
ncbi:MAG: HEAT repeat domain-containing protein [Deltaproteobacteria bacterium]|nr:HEAT repeat domain-containing protein [Deltaproteobacteria bacterium]